MPQAISPYRGSGRAALSSEDQNTINKEENAQADVDMRGRYGGSPQHNAEEMARTEQGLVRGQSLTDQGIKDEATLGALGAGYLQKGQAAQATSAGMQGIAGADYAQQLATRGQTQAGLDRMRQFYNQGPAPSVAQAQMGAAANAGMGDRMAMMTAGRGAGGNAASARMAMGQGAANMQQQAGQFANTRANEGSAWRGQQLQGMGTMQQGIGAMRTGDINSMNQNLGMAKGYGELGLGYGELGAKSVGQGMDTSRGYAEVGETAAQHAENIRQNYLMQQMQNDQAITDMERKKATADQELNDKKDAAAMGTVATIAGGVLGLSDIRTKRKIIPMPENY